MKKHTMEDLFKLGLGAGLLLTAGAGVFLALKSRREKVENKEYIKIALAHQASSHFETEDQTTPPSTALSFEDAYEIALTAAKEHFGENGFVVPASDKKAVPVNIGGVRRACYMFGADKMDFIDGSMKGLYHVDANTGDIFDNSAGDMKQIRSAS